MSNFTLTKISGIWKTVVLKASPRFWSFMLRLELFLIGAFFCKSALFDNQEVVWGLGRTLMLVVGIGLPVIAVVISFPKIIKKLDKLELFSRYLVQAPLWCCLSLLMIELTLRTTLRNPPLRRDVTNFAGDIPAVHSTILWGKEGYAITQYEKWGEIRTPHHDGKKDNNIIVLGDSQTEGLQVGDNFKFTSVAETVMRQNGYDVDLHNLGRSGLAMADYVSWIPPYQALYRSKVIVIQLTENDFIESFHLGQFNYFVSGDNKNIELEHVYDISSGFTQVARRQYELDPQIKDLGYQRWFLMQAQAASMPVEDENVSPKIEDIPVENSNTEVFDAELADQQMQMLIDASAGTPLVLVLLPSAPYIAGDEIQMADPTHEQLKEFIEHYPEITLVDPLPEFQRLASAGQLPRGFFNSDPGIGHLNKYGNEVVGRLLAQAIEQVLK